MLRAGLEASRRILAACALAVLVGCGAPQPQGPNLLLVVVDTLRADRLSPYGYADGETPRIARLASEGVRVTEAYAPSATTGPSHAGLFTGRYPRSVGVLRNAVPLGEGELTLAERLAAAGWETAAVVSSFPLNHRFGFAQGFGEYQDAFDAARATVRHERFEGHVVPEGFDRRADEASARALAWLEAGRGAARPFFLFVHYFDPHEPYAAPRSYQERFPVGKGASLRERAGALYDAEVAFTDAQIGRLLDGLDALGLRDDTLVVLTADHGEGLFSHGHLFHDVHLYEEAVRVPLILRGPGLPAGAVLAGPVTLLDLLPTLLDLLGRPLPAEEAAVLPGHSLAAALRAGEAPPGERSLFLERRRFRSERVGTLRVKGEQLAVRRGDWKYIEAPEEARRELYSLARDPQEREDLSAQEPERLAELAGELARWRTRTPLRAPAAEVDPEDRSRLEALGYAD